MPTHKIFIWLEITHAPIPASELRSPFLSLPNHNSNPLLVGWPLAFSPPFLIWDSSGLNCFPWNSQDFIHRSLSYYGSSGVRYWDTYENSQPWSPHNSAFGKPSAQGPITLTCRDLMLEEGSSKITVCSTVILLDILSLANQL